MNNSYREIGTHIMDAEKILIFPHVHMDGDCMGSSSALCLALRAQGKQAYVLAGEDAPGNLDFLEAGCFTRDPDVLDRIDLAIMVDCSCVSRIEGREKAFLKAEKTACIDHHAVVEPSGVEFDFGRIEGDSAAAGEMIELLLLEMGWEIDRKIAECLFAAITTDTGNFQHSNTTKRTHELAARLYDVEGFNSKPISNLIYNRHSFNEIRLKSLVMESMHLYHDGEIAVGRVTQEMLRKTGCRMDQSEGFVQDIMGIDGVEVGCLLKEQEEELVRLSLRSRSFVNVAEAAQAFGGGGHRPAAGATSYQAIDPTEREAVEVLTRQIEKDRASRETQIGNCNV